MKKKPFCVLGLEYGGHDTSASILIDGEIVAACEQERFDLEKHSRAFPNDSINECLKIAGLKNINECDEIAVGGDYIESIRKVYLEPALRDVKRIEFLLDDAERLKSFLNFEQIVRDKLQFKGNFSFHRHHLCHLATAYYPSGFNKALLASYDGMGEIETAMLGLGSDGDIEIIDNENHYPHSLGLFYSALTFYLGWKHHCDEGIIMGLAPFGDPMAIIGTGNKRYIDVFREIIYPTSDLKFEIDLSWIEYQNKRDTWISSKFTNLFGPKRNYDDPISQHHKNIAAALQLRLEELVLSQLKFLREKTGARNLCIAGGVGLNCSLNGKISDARIFDEIFVQPASGDAGISLGAAMMATKKHLGQNMKPCKAHNFYLGSGYSDDEIERVLLDSEVDFERPNNLYRTVASHLAEGNIVAWFQGRSEFGPRALGNRSILSRPFPAEQRDHINARVKFREEFRPFAPAILKENLFDYFEIDQESPHMLIACKVKQNKKNSIPATVHVDDTCRVQSVEKTNNQRFYELLQAFKELTGCPVLLNTSFNVKGQPIVNNPHQAVQTFLNTNIDILVVGSFVLRKVNNL